MKLSQLPIKIFLTITWILFSTEPGFSQIRNMSDITLPNPDNMVGEPSVNEDVVDNPDATVDEVTVDNPDTTVDETTGDNTNNLGENTAANSAATVEDSPTGNPTADSNSDVAPDTVTQDANSGDVDSVGTNEEPVDFETSTETTENNDVQTVDSEVVEAEPSTSILDQNETAVTVESESTEDIQVSEDAVDSNEVVQEETEVTPAQEKVEEEVAKEEVPEKEEVADESTSEEEDTVAEEEEVVEEKKSESADLGLLDRAAYEAQFQEAPSDVAIQMQEEFQLTQLMDSSGLELFGTVPSVKEISVRLAQLAEQTGKKPAFINISLQSNQLESFVVLPEQTQANVSGSVVASADLNGINPAHSETSTIRKTVKNTSRKDLIATANHFREEISDVRKLNQSEYKSSAQELYNALIKPIEKELEANDIDILVFSMDSGLRLLPVAALHDGEQFLIEKYAMGMVPSFGLTDTRYVSPEKGSILAMGASDFEEQASLPTMPIELETIVSNPRQGESFLNEQFTIPNFVAQNSRETSFSIIHLGTHAEFKAGDLSDSYIQFYDEKLKIPQLQSLSDELGWNTDATPVELLVLSACETALGDKEAELGFAGLAVQAGVKSALASLWYVSDLGTLALMGEFYDQLGNTLIKAEALRQTQLEMLSGNVMVDNREVKLSNGVDLPLPEDFPDGSLTLDHPYFWSSFTLIGNWN